MNNFIKIHGNNEHLCIGVIQKIEGGGRGVDEVSHILFLNKIIFREIIRHLKIRQPRLSYKMN